MIFINLFGTFIGCLLGLLLSQYISDLLLTGPHKYNAFIIVIICLVLGGFSGFYVTKKIKN